MQKKWELPLTSLILFRSISLCSLDTLVLSPRAPLTRFLATKAEVSGLGLCGSKESAHDLAFSLDCLVANERCLVLSIGLDKLSASWADRQNGQREQMFISFSQTCNFQKVCYNVPFLSRWQTQNNQGNCKMKHSSDAAYIYKQIPW